MTDTPLVRKLKEAGYSAEQVALGHKLGIQGAMKNGKVQFVDMGEGKVEPTTEGWTDDQIRNKSMDDLDLMITQNRKALEVQVKAVDDQKARIKSLKRIRKRKRELEGN